MGGILLGVSHKGGTGRSVALANIAYWLAAHGDDVCIVDLDLGSPTMGSVLRLPDLETGRDGDLGVHAFLLGNAQSGATVDSALVSVWGDAFPRPTATAGRFAFLPGTHRGDLDLQFTDLVAGLRLIFDDLAGKFDYVLADLRSGISHVAAALAEDEFAAHDLTWLLFYRWTPQHLNGLFDLADRLANSFDGPSAALIRTAFPDIEQYDGPLKRYVYEMNSRLDRQERRVQERLRDAVVLEPVPFDPVLQWEERVLTDGGDFKDVSAKTRGAYRSIASMLRAANAAS